MNTKHTPGPWKFSFESIHPEWAIVTTGGGAVVANVNADHRQEANASLIAAAPDLLEAGEAFLRELDEGDSFPAWEAAKAKLRAAIAKARGETANLGEK